MLNNICIKNSIITNFKNFLYYFRKYNYLSVSSILLLNIYLLIMIRYIKLSNLKDYNLLSSIYYLLLDLGWLLINIQF